MSTPSDIFSASSGIPAGGIVTIGAQTKGGFYYSVQSCPILWNAFIDPPVWIQTSRPAVGDPLDVVVNCHASSEGKDPAFITKRALFKVNNVFCTPGTGYHGTMKKLSELTIMSAVPPQLSGADFSIDIGAGVPGERSSADWASVAASVFGITLHGSAGDTLQWACDFSWSYFQPSRPMVDPRTCTPYPTQ